VLRLLTRRTRTFCLMAFGICAVVVLGVWDERREARRALDELAREHHLLAVSLAQQFNAEDGAVRPGGELGRPGQTLPLPRQLQLASDALQSEGALIVLWKLADPAGIFTASGTRMESPALEQALGTGASGITLDREAAARLGLPRRTAVAGLAPVSSGRVRGVAVVGSAGPLRDRGLHDQWRWVLSIALVAALIVGLGFVALRQQRRQLALEQEIALRRSQQERDAELAKANRMAALAALASGIAHEIGTPLGIIAGRIEQLRGLLGVDDRGQRLLSVVHAQVERIDRVVRSFLALARGDVPTLLHVQAQQVASSAEKLVRHRFEAARVRLDSDLGGAEAAVIACEPALFEQVLVNLLINALEASRAGQLVELRVECQADRVSFAVVDEGSVISPEVIARATEPFFTTKARHGGSGLGLAIAKEIIEHHRGQLSIRRRCELEGEGVLGTRVEVAVPLLQGNET
jgi:two-component system NtrC family sensor kinase